MERNKRKSCIGTLVACSVGCVVVCWVRLLRFHFRIYKFIYIKFKRKEKKKHTHAQHTVAKRQKVLVLSLLFPFWGRLFSLFFRDFLRDGLEKIGDGGTAAAEIGG